MPCAVSRRCSQNPSRPASKQHTTPIAASSRRATRARNDEMRANKAAVSPPSIRCRCDFSDPGKRAAMSQLDALSSMARWMVGLTLSIDCIVAAPSLDSGCRSICSARPHSIWNQTSNGVQGASGASCARISATRSAKFYERVHGLSILFISLGPGAHMREAQVLEDAIDRIVRHWEPELLMQPHDQIARPPAHHAMDRRYRALLYDAGEKGLMYRVELGRHPWRRNIDETVRSLLVEPDHPVPQRLTIHAANLRRLFPRGPLEHGRNR